MVVRWHECSRRRRARKSKEGAAHGMVLRRSGAAPEKMGHGRIRLGAREECNARGRERERWGTALEQVELCSQGRAWRSGLGGVWVRIVVEKESADAGEAWRARGHFGDGRGRKIWRWRDAVER